MDENSIIILNTSRHKSMTDNHLAQVNFTAMLPKQLWDMYIGKTSMDHEALGRIRFMTTVNPAYMEYVDNNKRNLILVFGRVSHGYGYDISQDIFNAIMYSKGVK